nr:hypothetical protein [Tanacetum cinerariifolium]
MLQELKSMFEKQAGVERFDLIQTFHACKEDEGKPIGPYVIKMMNYVAQLKRLGYVLPRDLSVGLILNGLTSDFDGFAATPQVMEIQGGRIQKANKKSLNAKGKEHPTKDDTCHHCKEVGHCKRSYPTYLAELIKKKKQVGTANSLDIFLTPPYTPQHNEVSERKNRTLLDMVQSMMNLTTLLLSFWDYALESTTRILNMDPAKNVDKTPYELWYGKVPNLSYLKVGGCEALVKRDTPNKLQQRSDEDTSPSENTSKIPMEVEGFEPPQEEVIPIRRSVRTHRAPKRLCLNVEVEMHSLGDLNEPANYKAEILDPKSDKWLDAMNAEIKSTGYWCAWVCRVFDKEHDQVLDSRFEDQGSSDVDLVKCFLEGFPLSRFHDKGLAVALEELPAATIAAYDNVIRKKGLRHIDLINFAIWSETLKLEDVLATFISRELQKMMKAKGNGGEGLYVRGRSSLIDIEQGIITRNLKVLSGIKIRYPVPELIGGSYHITYRRDYLVEFEKYDGGNILLVDGREYYVRRTSKVQVQMRDGSSFVLDNVRYVLELKRNLILLGTLKKEGFTVKMQSGKIKVIKDSLVVLSGTKRAICVYTLDGQSVTRKTLKGRKQLGEYLTGWKIKMGNVLDFCNQRSTQQCMKSMVAKNLGVAVIQQQNGLVKESNVTLLAKVRCFLIQSGLSKDLIYYHPARDREQHSAWELFSYREDSNEAAFAVAAADMIYAHESLTFNIIVAYEIIKDQSGNTLRVSQSRFYNGILVQTLLEGHFILSLEGNLSGDCDVEKNGNWSCIYAVGSQEYQVVYTIPDIASVDVDILDGFDRGLQTYVKVFVDFDYAMGRSITVMAGYMTLTEAAKEATGLKGLAIESRFELKITGIAISALSKAIPSPRFQHWLKLLRIEEG